MTPKHKKFIEEYMSDLDGPAAARRAGYTKKDSVTTSARLLANEDISGFIKKALKDQLSTLDVTESRILKEYARIGFADITDIVKFSHGDGVELKCHSASLDKDITAAIASVQSTPAGPKINMHPKMAALDMMAKYLGMVVDKKELGKPGDFDHLTDEELAAEVAKVAGRIGGTGILKEITSSPSGTREA